MDEETFLRTYRGRVEAKLRYKNTQISRTERLLESLSPEQRPAFESLLQEAIDDRDELQREMEELLQTLKNFSIGK